MNSNSTTKICVRGIWDDTIPGIKYDEKGVSNYAKMFDNLCTKNPKGEEGRQIWNDLVSRIKKDGKRKKYDCLIGVSGGTDSSYLVHIAKHEYGLKPLAVNLDNGWSSDIAVQNIKKVTKALDIDLETYVIDYEEIKDLLRVYMKAGLPWIDNPTDLAIQAVLFKIANKENIKYIFAGNDFRSEGKQPTEWTYSDQKQLNYLHKKFGKVSLNSYPIMPIQQYLWFGLFKGIRIYYPFNHLPYDKQSAQKLIIEKYNWVYYGEHHHENLFTKWAIGYWMLEKFGIDKRKITYSAQVLNNVLSREEALQIVAKKPFSPEQASKDTAYVLKKLDLTDAQFQEIWHNKNHSFLDYPSYYSTIKKYAKPISWLLNRFFKIKPKIFTELEARESN